MKITFSHKSLSKGWQIPEATEVKFAKSDSILSQLTDFFITDFKDTRLLDDSVFRLTKVIADCGKYQPSIEEIRIFFVKGGYNLILNDKDKVVESIKRTRNIFHKNEFSDFQYCGIVGNSPLMVKLYTYVKKIAKSNATALIRGESGSGKELVAKAIHSLSDRNDKPYVVVNCAAIPETLLEDELFGHVKGAFTDAKEDRKGCFEEADGGVIFLDEIGDMPISLQVKLLRVLQEHEIQPLGSNKVKKINVRVISATAVNLEDKIKENKFRKDLYYRLNVVPLYVPSLRERKDDIPLLVYYFMDDITEKYRFKPIQISVKALKMMKYYNWPGNVRELQNYVERLIVLNRDKKQIEENDLPPLGTGDTHFKKNNNFIDEFPMEGMNFDTIVSKVERELILKSLEQTEGNQTKAAQLLELKRTTFIEKMKKHI